jgi:hypothetical protein
VISCDAGRIVERSRDEALATILQSDCAALTFRSGAIEEL